MNHSEYGSSGIVDAVPYVRAKIPDVVGEEEGGVQADDWRAPELPYVVPDDLRLPWEQLTGRPSTGMPCTEDTARRLEHLIINGVSVLAAKTMLGIRKQRWIEWMDAARQGKAPYSLLQERIRMATAHVEATANATIRRGVVHPDPKIAMAAAKTTLEHVNPAKYAPQTRNKTDVTVTMTAQINTQAIVALASLPAETVQMLANALTARPLIEQTAPTPLLSAFEDED
jgi:ABC-type ATPase with predicted acetyltransferase domain